MLQFKPVSYSIQAQSLLPFFSPSSIVKAFCVCMYASVWMCVCPSAPMWVGVWMLWSLSGMSTMSHVGLLVSGRRAARSSRFTRTHFYKIHTGSACSQKQHLVFNLCRCVSWTWSQVLKSIFVFLLQLHVLRGVCRLYNLVHVLRRVNLSVTYWWPYELQQISSRLLEFGWIWS